MLVTDYKSNSAETRHLQHELFPRELTVSIQVEFSENILQPDDSPGTALLQDGAQAILDAIVAHGDAMYGESRCDAMQSTTGKSRASSSQGRQNQVRSCQAYVRLESVSKS